MRKENEFGGEYHQMNFSREELEEIATSLKYEVVNVAIDHPAYTMLLNIIDRIEKELGIE